MKLAMKLAGVFASLPTPFGHGGEMYMSKVRHNLALWNRMPLAGYLVGSGTGEGTALEFEEKSRLWEETAKGVPPEKVLLAGIQSEGVRQAVREVNRAAEAGCQAAVVAMPAFGGEPAEASATAAVYFQAVADQSRLPLIVSCPARGWAAAAEPDVLISLAGHPNIVALRIGTGDPALLDRWLEAAAGQITIIAANGSNLYRALAAGTPVISSFAALAPYYCLTIEEAVRRREFEAAEDLQRRATRAATEVIARHGVPGLKYAMDLQGYYGGPPRLPLYRVNADARQEIEAALHGISS